MRRKYLFLDERHISAGQLAWQSAGRPARPAARPRGAGHTCVRHRSAIGAGRRTPAGAAGAEHRPVRGAREHAAPGRLLLPAGELRRGPLHVAVLSDHLPLGRRSGRLLAGAPGQPRRLLPGIAGRLRVDRDQPVPDRGIRSAGSGRGRLPGRSGRYPGSAGTRVCTPPGLRTIRCRRSGRSTARCRGGTATNGHGRICSSAYTRSPPPTAATGRRIETR